MENKWIEMTADFLDKKSGSQFNLAANDADGLIKAGVAKEVTVDVTNELVATATKGVAEKIGTAMEKNLTTFLEQISAKISNPRAVSVVTETADKNKSFGDFLLKMAARDAEGLSKIYHAKAALSEASGISGGYLVPPEYLAQILQVRAEDAIVRPRADIVQMGSRTIQIPMLDQTTVQAVGVTPFFGGMIPKWTAEVTTRPETEPQFKQVELVAHELAGLSKVSRILMQDSPISVNTMLIKNIGGAMGWAEDYAFLQGDGSGKPKGVLNSPACATVTRTGSSTSLPLADVAAMYGKLLPTSVKNACWVMSQTCLPLLIKLADASGRVIYLPNPTYQTEGGSVTKAVPMTLLGLPVIITEKLPAAGTAGDVLLCDFSHYKIGDRGTLEINSSEHFNFDTNQLAWRFIHRVDGQPWMDAPFTLQDGTTQVSPFVKLV